eukprot:CAMPEP_0179082290 /NCGR_PEP_ID=MMETSP0796-20121207/37098_1 /TAXON_ID=73915 /ORGANISM="Pyrodinium bahamense, Strain pbaha01" /LENGTH=93 /DNA_ID=CAMNT_0020779685 /DNA_START=35 /DNA_END=313 /DNA_ORIENTATION=-
MAPCYGVLYAALAVAVLVPHVGGCDYEKLMELNTTCPSMSVEGGDDMMAMIQAVCEPGSCSTLVKELMEDCANVDGMEGINMLGAMCGSGSGK